MSVQNQEPPNPDISIALPTQLSPEAKQKLESILRLLEPCQSRQEYGQRLREEAAKLKVSIRTMQRYISAWRDKGLVGLQDDMRSDKGKSRMDSELQAYATKLFKNRKRSGREFNRLDIYRRVKQKAVELNL